MAMGFDALSLLGAAYVYKGLFKVNSPPGKSLNWQSSVGGSVKGSSFGVSQIMSSLRPLCL